MTQKELIWRIAGGSGDGTISTGENVAKALMRMGMHVFTHRHYPSRIRGGHLYVEVRADDKPVRSRGDGHNFLVALGDSFARNPTDDAYYGNEELKPITENLDDLHEGGVILYDEGLIDIDEVPDFEERVEENNWRVYPIDLRGIAKDHGREVMRNSAAVGATAALLGIGTEPFLDVMEDSKMSGDVLESNLEILQNTHELVSDEFETLEDFQVPAGEHDEGQVFLNGSTAVAYGALDEGCRFIAGYPMTPWTGVFTIMSNNLPDFGGISEQVEDEIAAAALAIGASHVGVKAMSGSSGGGFALMSEPLGLAEMTETPIVLIEAMRGGGSTGMPTKPEQGDLEHVLYTSQGDSNRVVFAPGNIAECYEQTRRAFQIAYEYNIPAIVVIDQKLSGEFRNVDESFFDQEPNPALGATLSEEELAEAAHHHSGKFNRYSYDSENGASPRSIPGQKGGRFLASGNEHNQVGHISEDPDNRVIQMGRRMQKLESIREEIDGREVSNQTYHGPDDADFGLITWGSQQGTVIEAVDRLNDAGHSVKALSVSNLMPLAEEELTEFLESVDEAVVVEMNATGQLRGLIQKELGWYGRKMSGLLKYSGNPFEPAEIVEGVESLLAGEPESPGNETEYVPTAGD